MTTPMDDTLTAIGRQLSVAYLPTVLEQLPRELNDLVAQLVAFEMRKRELSKTFGDRALRYGAARAGTQLHRSVNRTIAL
jgi:hypothetical protein